MISKALTGSVALALLLTVAYPAALGRPHHHRHTDTPSSVARDDRGRIHRSPQARQQFKNSLPCPATGKSYGACPGYVIDHVVPLKRGGADAPYNMQWQTKEAAKQKDKIE